MKPHGIIGVVLAGLIMEKIEPGFYPALCTQQYNVTGDLPLSCFLGEAGGAGQSHRKTYRQPPHQCRRFCRYNGADESGGQGCQILFPVFGGEMATAKIQTVKGLRVEILSRPLQKNTTRPLTVWIVGTE